MKTLRIPLLCLAVATGLFAQPPGGGGGHGRFGGPGPGPGPNDQAEMTALKTFLNLTDAQLTSLQSIEQSHRQAARALQAEARTSMQAMRQATDSGSADQIAAASQAMKAHQAKMQNLRDQYKAQATAVLTPEQSAKLKVLSDAAALMPNFHAAQRLNLLTPPQGAGPDGFGRGGFGPAMRRGGPGGPPPPPPPHDQE